MRNHQARAGVLSRVTARVALGAVLTLTLAAPATLAHATTDLADDITEAAGAVTAETVEQIAPKQIAPEPGSPAEEVPAPEPAVSEPAPAPVPETAPQLSPAPDPSAALALAPEATAEQEDSDTALRSEEAAPPTEQPEATAPRTSVAEVDVPTTNLLPPNTARYVTFKVVDPSGDPVIGGSLSIHDFGETVIDVNGEARFMSMPYGTYQFTAHRNIYSHANLQSQTGELVVNQLTHEVFVTLQTNPGVSDYGIHGVVTDASTGLPLRRGTLYINRVGGGEDQRTPGVQADGSFSIIGLGTGEYRVYVESDGYASYTTMITPTSGGAELNVALTPNRDYLSGFVTDRNGFPVRGARVAFIDPDTLTVVRDTPLYTSGMYLSYFGVDYYPPNGVYLVRVTPPAGSDLGVTYYPSASSPAEAVPVDMSAGSLVRHADITMLGTPLVAVDDAYSTPLDTPLGPDHPDDGLLANDDGYEMLRLVGLQGDATANPSITRASDEGGEVIAHQDGTFWYAPPAGFTGVDTFTYLVTDASGGAPATATVQITVGDAAPTDPADDENDDDTTDTSGDTDTDTGGTDTDDNGTATGSGGGSESSAGSERPAPDGGTLATTGSSSSPLSWAAALGAAFLAAGSLTLVIRRHRRAQVQS